MKRRQARFLLTEGFLPCVSTLRWSRDFIYWGVGGMGAVPPTFGAQLLWVPLTPLPLPRTKCQFSLWSLNKLQFVSRVQLCSLGA